VVMTIRVLIVVQRDLYDWYIQRVLRRIKSCAASASATRCHECLALTYRP
jgi:hypothetical protein